MAVNDTLEMTNIEQLKTEIPSIIFVSIIMIIGIIGNIHTILVYALFYGKGNHRHYILWLSTFDLLACGITIPMVISKYVNTYTYRTNINCQMTMYFSTFFAGFNLALLDIIAIDRYRRISSPLKKQLSHRGGQTACIITCVLFFILSVPNLLIYHAQEVALPNSEHSGYSCYIREEYNLVDTVYTIVQAVVVIFLLVFCIVLYSLVLWNLIKLDKVKSSGKRKISMNSVLGFIRSRMNSISASSTTESNATCVSTIEIRDTIDVTKCNQKADFGNESQQNIIPLFSNETQTTNPTLVEENECNTDNKESEDNEVIKVFSVSKLTSTKSDIGCEIRENKSRHRNNVTTRGRRVTVMFMVVSVGACIVYLPTILLKILIAFYFGDSLFETLQGWFGVLGYFYMLNHAINPIVYGFLDVRFRQKCKNMYSMANPNCRCINKT